MNTNTVTISLYITSPLIIQQTSKYSITTPAAQCPKNSSIPTLLHLGLGERDEPTQAQWVN